MFFADKSLNFTFRHCILGDLSGHCETSRRFVDSCSVACWPGAGVGVLHVGHADGGVADSVVDHRVHRDRHAVLRQHLDTHLHCTWAASWHLPHLLGRHTEGDGPQVHSLVRLDAGKNEKYALKAQFRGSCLNLKRYIPGPFAPPGSNLPILNITALSYSWTTCKQISLRRSSEQ